MILVPEAQDRKRRHARSPIHIRVNSEKKLALICALSRLEKWRLAPEGLEHWTLLSYVKSEKLELRAYPNRPTNTLFSRLETVFSDRLLDCELPRRREKRLRKPR
jgi:hypothetical protein